jgi:hypothetical protein
MRSLSQWLLIIVLLSLFSTSIGTTPMVTAAENPPGTPAATLQATPLALVSDEPIDGFTLAAPRLFWWQRATCVPTLAALEPVDELSEAISRIATHGSDARRLYYRSGEEVGSRCGLQDIQFSPRSNLIADEDYLYWISGDGLVRLPTDANPGDEPEVFNAALDSNSGAELVQDADEIFALLRGGSENQIMSIRRIAKSNGTANTLFFNLTTGDTVQQLALDSEYLYWLADGTLQRYDLAAGGSAVALTNDVLSFFSEGQRGNTHYVYISKGYRLYRYNNQNDSLSAALYTSPDSDARIHEITGDGSSVFFFERRPLACDSFCHYNSLLIRTNRSLGSPATLYSADTSTVGPRRGLLTDGTFLFWNFEGLQRLPNNAEALPTVDMEITDIEVTQGIQDLDNSVPLIENRRTFVRVHVRSKVANTSVAGVTARLVKVGATEFDSGLVPVNPVGQTITVHPSPDRDLIDHSFLFELPWSWTTGEATLQARLNPFQYPLEPSYGPENQRSIYVNFKPSPRLEMQLIRWGYTTNGTTYYPRLIEDVELTYSWIRRAYPLSSAPGSADDPSPGFRPTLISILDANLATRVDRSHEDCVEMNDPSLCASTYTNAQMDARRDEEGIPDEIFMYGMISDAAGVFPRGRACCGTNVSSGPVGIPGDVQGWTWDTDETYGDWYAGHEIGHTLGRGHPAASSESCGNSAADENYPYAGAAIGPANGSLVGFDVGDPAFGIEPAVLPADQWFDLMSYCANQWISDYTYEAMYEHMLENTQLAQHSRLAATRQSGDFLSVYGIVMPEAGKATMIHTSRKSSVARIPPLVPGPYALRLLGNGTLLAEYAFSAGDVGEAKLTHGDEAHNTLLSFGQIVPFAPGTSSIQIVRLSDGAVLASEAVSANAPTISNIQLAPAAAPVTGTTTLSWNASDADGDALSFDVYASRDGGATLQPILLNTSGSSTPINTNDLAGGDTIFRVIASDGVQTAQADSSSVELANKPPQPTISNPGNNAVFAYGQLINFSGEAFDLQDGSVAARNLIWSNQDGPLGQGPLLSLADLPVGVNTISLRARNSVGLTATTTITVIIEDNLALPGPTLTAGPTAISWHVAEGTSEMQHAQITISNAGSGTVSWQASSNAGWLTVNQNSGSAPAQLSISANPAGLAVGSTAKATITITSANGDSVTIPVSLSIGNTHDHDDDPPTTPARRTVYLPLIRQ